LLNAIVTASVGKGYLRMDTETAKAKSSARDRLGLDKTTKSAGRTSSNQVGRKVILYLNYFE
jgi:hypothetical protein